MDDDAQSTAPDAAGESGTPQWRRARFWGYPAGMLVALPLAVVAGTAAFMASSSLGPGGGLLAYVFRAVLPWIGAGFVVGAISAAVAGGEAWLVGAVCTAISLAVVVLGVRSSVHLTPGFGAPAVSYVQMIILGALGGLAGGTTVGAVRKRKRRLAKR